MSDDSSVSSSDEDLSSKKPAAKPKSKTLDSDSEEEEREAKNPDEDSKKRKQSELNEKVSKDDEEEEGEDDEPSKKKAKGMIESEADEEDSDDSEGKGKKKLSKKKKKRKSLDSDDDSEDEEGGGADDNDYEKDGFVVSESDEEDSGSDSDAEKEVKKKKRRFKKAKKAIRLDEDDLDLVREAKANEESRSGFVDEELEDDFDDDDGDGFIVDVKKRKKKGRKLSEFDDEDDEEGEEEGEEEVDENERLYNDLFGYSNEDFLFPEDGERDEEQELDFEDKDDAEKMAKNFKAQMEEMYDFATRAQNYMLEEDEEIIKVDLPERFQLIEKSMRLKRKAFGGEFFLRSPESFSSESSSLSMEMDPMSMSLTGGNLSSSANSPAAQRTTQARWVYLRLAEAYASRGESDKYCSESELVEPIKNALRFLQQKNLEAPFIYTYRYNSIKPLTLEDLFAIHDLSLRYAQIVDRREIVTAFIRKVVPEDFVDDETIQGDLVNAEGEINTEGVGGSTKPFRDTLLKMVNEKSLDGLTMDWLRDVQNYVIFKFGYATDASAEQAIKARRRKAKRKAKLAKKRAMEKSKEASKNNSNKQNDKEIDDLFELDEDDKKQELQQPNDQDGSTSQEKENNGAAQPQQESKDGKEEASSSESDGDSDDDDLSLEDDDDQDMDGDGDNEERLMRYRQKARKVEESMKKKRDKLAKQKVKRRNEHQAANYLLLRKHNLESLTKAIASPSRFAACVSAEQAIFPVSEHSADTAMMAISVISNELDSEEAVLKAAVTNLARELAFEPRVRETLRKLYRRYGAVSTRLTVRGRGMIATDPLSEYYAIASLRDKPFSTFLASPIPGKPDFRDQFLLILKAEKEGMLIKKANRAELTYQLMMHFAPFLLSPDGASRLTSTLSLEKGEVDLTVMAATGKKEETQLRMPEADVFDAWDKLRFEVLKATVSRFMLPFAEKQMFQDLQQHAREFVTRQACDKLWEYATIAPVTFPMEHPEIKVPSNRWLRPCHVTVMGVFLTDEKKEPNFAVVLRGDGSIKDYDKLPSIIKRNEVESRLLSFIDRSRPHIVALNASAGLRVRGILKGLEREAADRARKIADSANDYMDDHYVYVEENADGLFFPIIFDDHVAYASATCENRTKEFPEFHTHQRRALSIARCAQNQLTEVCALWTDYSRGDVSKLDTNEIFSLILHPLQTQLPPLSFLRSLEQVLVTAVALGGVDLNHVVRQSYARTVVPFVPGLGFRKAKDLVSTLYKASRTVTERSELAPALGADSNDETGSMDGNDVGGVVYKNASGFLMIWDRAADPFDDSERRMQDGDSFNLFDMSRIHPELEDLAVYLCWEVRHPDKHLPERDEDGKLAYKTRSCIREVMEKSFRRLGNKVDNDAFWIAHRGAAFWSPFSSVSRSAAVNRKRLLFEDASVVQDQAEELKWHIDGDLIQASNLDSAMEALQAVCDEDILNKDQLILCKREIQLPFFIPFRVRGPPSEAELFDLLSGEDDKSLCQGTDVTVRISGFQDQWVQVQLPNGLRGSIHIANMTDDYVKNIHFGDRTQSSNDPPIKRWVEENLGLSLGSYVAARVLEVRKDRFSLRLTAKPRELSRPPYLKIDDPYWTRPETLEERKAARRGKARTADGALKRPITHPAFQNITREEAEQYLADKMVGEYVVRPSTRGVMHLSITWKVANEPIPLYQHIGVDEAGKRPGDAKLGKPLRVGNTEFDDLDELLARHVSATADFLMDLYSFRVFKNISRSEVEQLCSKEKAKAPKRIPYFIIPLEGHPGYFALHFQPGQTVRRAKISVTPEGFKLEGRTFNDLEMMISFFKTNFQNFGQPPQRSRHSGGSRRPGGGGGGGGGYGSRGYGSRSYGQSRSGPGYR